MISNTFVFSLLVLVILAVLLLLLALLFLLVSTAAFYESKKWLKLILHVLYWVTQLAGKNLLLT